METVIDNQVVFDNCINAPRTTSKNNEYILEDVSLEKPPVLIINPCDLTSSPMLEEYDEDDKREEESHLEDNLMQNIILADYDEAQQKRISQIQLNPKEPLNRSELIRRKFKLLKKQKND